MIKKIVFRLERWFLGLKSERMKGDFKRCGTNVSVDATCQVIYPQNFAIGDNSLIAPYTTIYAAFGVTVGKNCLISSNCGISSINHVINSDDRHRDDQDNIKYSKPVVIDDNVWIGMNVCVLPGVTIGKNSIIGSGSVVTKSVPPNEIWVGNPARFIKKLELNA
ncbi:acyltransferase [uncultured Mucilaginibacter sp.]|uniref:acyltransferase n=1 Tax=uncultured Mucilaginibacter sp. TaxID=797541 RepID=UPI0025DF36DA|nr:acyltransferase [uncultured Mucilaginibacter sp.]